MFGNSKVQTFFRFFYLTCLVGDFNGKKFLELCAAKSLHAHNSFKNEDFEGQRRESDFFEYEDDEDFQSPEQNQLPLDDDSDNYPLDCLEPIEAVEPRERQQNDDQLALPEVKNSRIIASWDQSPIAIHEDYSNRKEAFSSAKEAPSSNKLSNSLQGEDNYQEKSFSKQRRPVSDASKSQLASSETQKLNKGKDSTDRHQSSNELHNQQYQKSDYSAGESSETSKSRLRGSVKSNLHLNNKFARERGPSKLDKRELSLEDLISNLIDNWVAPGEGVDNSEYSTTEPQTNDTKGVDKQEGDLSKGKEENSTPTALSNTTPPLTTTAAPSTACPTTCFETSTQASNQEKSNKQSFIEKMKNAVKSLFSSKKDSSNVTVSFVDDDPDLFDEFFDPNDQLAPLSDGNLDYLSAVDNPAEPIDEEGTVQQPIQASDTSKDADVLQELKSPEISKPLVAFEQFEDSIDLKESKSSEVSKESHLEPTDVLKNFTKSDLQFLRHLISCMKQSNLTPDIIQEENSKNRSTETLNSSSRRNKTQLGAAANYSMNAVNVTHKMPQLNVTDEQSNKSVISNFSQYVVECQPIVVKASNTSDQQFISFNCKFLLVSL